MTGFPFKTPGGPKHDHSMTRTHRFALPEKLYYANRINPCLDVEEFP